MNRSPHLCAWYQSSRADTILISAWGWDFQKDKEKVSSMHPKFQSCTSPKNLGNLCSMTSLTLHSSATSKVISSQLQQPRFVPDLWWWLHGVCTFVLQLHRFPPCFLKLFHILKRVDWAIINFLYCEMNVKSEGRVAENKIGYWRISVNGHSIVGADSWAEGPDSPMYCSGPFSIHKIRMEVILNHKELPQKIVDKNARDSKVYRSWQDQLLHKLQSAPMGKNIKRKSKMTITSVLFSIHAVPILHFSSIKIPTEMECMWQMGSCSTYTAFKRESK